MSKNIKTLKKFVEKRLDWNNFLHKKDPKVSDIGRIEEDKCILRYIEKIIEDESTSKDNL